MDLAQFVQQGWQQHGDDEEGVFARLPEGVGLVTEAKHIPALAGLIVHVAGEHLGRWADGLALLDQLAEHAAHDPATPAGKSLYRSMAILQHCAGNAAECDVLLQRGHDPERHEHSGRVRVLAVATSALMGQKRIDEAMQTFGEALELASYGPTKDDPAAISLAITGNNAAATLEEWTDRDGAASALMLRAARTGRRYWEIAGTWTNVERAEYRLAMTNLQVGDSEAAIRHAQLCMDVCRENDADAAELFFADEALAKSWHAHGNAAKAQAHRDAVAAHLAAITDDSMQSYCSGELTKLDAALSA